MIQWSHGSRMFGVVETYDLHDNAWVYELTGGNGSSFDAFLAVAFPDATPIGDFTSMAADRTVVHVAPGTIPWPVLRKFLDLVDRSNFLVDDQEWGSVVAADPLSASHVVWTHEDASYDVNSFHHSDRDGWCYELCAPIRPDRNDFLDVLVPDVAGDGQFAPASADHVVLAVHGEWTVPWPIFRKFVEVVASASALTPRL
jgi:hypothetical protein